jgi:TrmH family RNA methyltransferase
MPVRIVQSKQNARLKELKRALAQPGRNAAGLAGIDGPNLVAEAVRSGLEIDCVFVAQGAERLLHELSLDGPGLAERTEVLLVPGEILSSALATETPQPVAALVRQREWTWSDVLGAGGSTAPLVLVLAGIQDPGNLGTILRSAEAFGASGVVALPGTVSEWNPKAVRASAGSVFRVPLIAADVEKCFAHLHEAGVAVWTTATRDAVEAASADLARVAALVIGNEGNGVPREVALRADHALTIPCPGPVESLNAAVAASVMLYEAARQRAAQQVSAQPNSAQSRSSRSAR